MFLFAKPTGGLYIKNRLLDPPAVTRIRVHSPVRIAMVSDIHLRRNGLSMAETVARQLTELKPHLILLGGDYAEFRKGNEILFERLSCVLPDVPKLAVAGNNDDPLYKNDPETLRRLMAESSITLLRNECVRLTIDGHVLEIAGVEDIYYGAPCAKGLFSEEEGVYRILLSHAPHSFLLEECAPDLMLSGHTHGGQVNVLGFTCYLLGYEGGKKYTHLSGIKRRGHTLCAVCNGIGTSKFPIRFGVKPEILLTED